MYGSLSNARFSPIDHSGEIQQIGRRSKIEKCSQAVSRQGQSDSRSMKYAYVKRCSQKGFLKNEIMLQFAALPQ